MKHTCMEKWFSTENIFTFTLFSKFSVFKPSSGNNNRQEYSIDILVINDFTYQNETFELVFVCEKNIPKKFDLLLEKIGGFYDPPKFLLLLFITSFLEFNPLSWKRVPKLHIHLSSSFFKFTSSSHESRRVICSLSM